MTLPLTENQERVWRYIASCERSPTYREIVEALGFKSTSQVNAIVETLRKKGFVHYVPLRARSLVALDPQTDLERVPTPVLAAELARRLAA